MNASTIGIAAIGVGTAAAVGVGTYKATNSYFGDDVGDPYSGKHGAAVMGSLIGGAALGAAGLKAGMVLENRPFASGAAMVAGGAAAAAMMIGACVGANHEL